MPYKSRADECSYMRRYRREHPEYRAREAARNAAPEAREAARVRDSIRSRKRRATRPRVGAKRPWRTLSYASVHQRAERLRGKASAHPCAHCGGPAVQWAYDHGDTHPMLYRRYGCTLPYSSDPEHYIPLCIPCHKRMDIDQHGGVYRKHNVARA
jgi:hypothetical protein